MNKHDFQSFYTERRISTVLPYFIKYSNLFPSSRGPKDGFYLIKNEQEEENFYKLQYWRENHMNIPNIADLRNRTTPFPLFFQVVVDLAQDKTRKTFPAVGNRDYLIEETQNWSNGVRKEFIYKIDSSGSMIGNKINYQKKISGNYYYSNFLYQPGYIIDRSLDKKSLEFHKHEIIEKAGLIIKGNLDTKITRPLKYGFYFFSLEKKIDHFYDVYEKKNFELILTEYPLIVFDTNGKLISVRSIPDNEVPKREKIYNYHTGRISIIDISTNIFKKNKYIFLSDHPKDIEFYMKIDSLSYHEKLNYELFKSFELRNFERRRNGRNDLNYIEKFLNDLDEFERIEKAIYHQKDEHCYVATMVYKDIDHPKLRMLRDFRDQTLSNFQIGKIFIIQYYKYSPAFVDRFRNNILIIAISKALIETFLFILESLKK